jgi:hypothetical protein
MKKSPFVAVQKLNPLTNKTVKDIEQKQANFRMKTLFTLISPAFVLRMYRFIISPFAFAFTNDSHPTTLHRTFGPF